MPVEIKINYSAGDTAIKLFNNIQIQEYLITLPEEPMSIVFDPDNWILKDILSIVSEVEEENYPSEFFLSQNYPNPFNPTTKIKYSIPPVGTQRAVSVQIKVYDVLGNEIETLINEQKPAGTYEVPGMQSNYQVVFIFTS